MLDLVTTLDPRFTVAYRFGAIFLTEAYPNGPGRPDQSIALLERGIEQDGGRWEYMHDIGFIYYWWLKDYAKAAEWFDRAGKAPGAPTWLAPMAATTLAVGGDRQSSRTLWRQLMESSDIDWIRSNAERRLLQLDAMDMIDQLNVIADRYEAREGHVAQSWQTLVAAERLRGVPLDPAGTPFVINPTTGRIGLAPDSPLAPLPEEPRPPAPRRSPRRGHSRDHAGHLDPGAGDDHGAGHWQLPERRHLPAAARPVAADAALHVPVVQDAPARASTTSRCCRGWRSAASAITARPRSRRSIRSSSS